jgi:hypothetical protein
MNVWAHRQKKCGDRLAAALHHFYSHRRRAQEALLRFRSSVTNAIPITPNDAGSGTIGTISTPRKAVANVLLSGAVTSAVRLAANPKAVPLSSSRNTVFRFEPLPSKLVT